MSDEAYDANIDIIMRLGELIQAKRATPLDAVQWLELVSNGNEVRDKAVELIRNTLTRPTPGDVGDNINRTNDEEIINLVRTVMDNGTGRAETANEHILLKLMQIRGTPMTSFVFDQDRVDFHYAQWLSAVKGGE